MRGRGAAAGGWRASRRWRPSRHRAAPAPRRGCRSAGSASQQRACVTSTRGAGVRQHEGQPLGRVGRIERQIGAAGLEDAEQADHHLRRALQAKPDHASPARPPDRADGAPAGWRAPPARRSSACGPRTPPPPPRACGQPAPRTAPAASLAATACAVAFHCDSMVRALGRRQHAQAARSAGPGPPPRLPAAGSAAPPSTSTLPRSNRSLEYSSTPVDPRRRAVPAAPLHRLTDRSNFALRASAPPRARAASPANNSPAHSRSETPASPGTADAATATAPG